MIRFMTILFSLAFASAVSAEDGAFAYQEIAPSYFLKNTVEPLEGGATRVGILRSQKEFDSFFGAAAVMIPNQKFLPENFFEENAILFFAEWGNTPWEYEIVKTEKVGATLKVFYRKSGTSSDSATYSPFFMLGVSKKLLAPDTKLETIFCSSAPIELFDGKDFSKHWYVYLMDRGVDNDPNGVFVVRNGVLHISGEEMGCITTREIYENYRLIVEYRWTGAALPPREKNARDCGVLVHSVGADGAWGKTWMYSLECNIIEGGTGDFIVVGDKSENFSITATIKPELQKNCGVYDPNGTPHTIHVGRINWFGRDPNWSDTIGFRGANDIERPVGEWNTLEVVCDGDEITNILNGVVVNHATDVKPTRGKIQIQSEYAGVEIRRITLVPIK
ncbi:MAG: DUF1080 domain-containing protein [Planctomycetia bacterium]|nr:DUF1080 domain-containing protein [Planctomycetia bacterium]